MRGLLVLLAAPACIGLPTEVELYASRYRGDQDLKHGGSGDVDGHEVGVSLHFPITYSDEPPGATTREHCSRLAPAPALELPSSVVPGASPPEPDPEPKEPEEPPQEPVGAWYESDKFLAWIERIVLVILAAGGTLAGKKGLDVHTERKRRRNHG